MSNRRYFGTDGVRGTVGETPITPEFVMDVCLVVTILVAVLAC